MWFFWVILALALCHAISTVFSFFNNLAAAKKTGLPIVISPVSRINPAWMILQKSLVPILVRLPFGLGSFTRYSTMNWWFTEKHRIHQQYGKVFMYVSPGINELHCADPLVNQQIFSRRRDFEKPLNLLKATRIYGDSVTTVTGSDWQRHRRITTPPFNEWNNKLVWDEAVRQASQVGGYWSDHESAGFDTTTQDWTTVTLNILATAALGESWDFSGAEYKQQSQGHSRTDAKMTYRDCLFTLASSVRMLVLTPTWLYSVPPSWLPTELKQFVDAYHQFEQYLKQMVKKKKDQVAAGEAVDATLLTTLVLKSQELNPDEVSSGGLSDEELYGNLFTYNIAGHETTAGTLGFATYLLAAYPEWQEWAWEEVDVACGSNSDIGSMSYEEVYPQLKRCLAIMLETLRLYGPIHSVFKSTVGPHGQELVIDGRTIHIPPNTYVLPNIIASHTLPEFWGNDHLDWNPGRWIKSSTLTDTPADEPVSTSVDLKDDASIIAHSLDALKVESDEILAPPKGKDTYIPWSGGSRVCPGRKFSQVEFVAAISVLLRKYAIEVVPRSGGETVQQARRRCLAVIHDSETQITLQMKDPTSVRLRLVKRQY